MKLRVIKEIEQQNPWLKKQGAPLLAIPNYRQRLQLNTLMEPEWDSMWTILIGRRRAGKTTLGKYLCEQLIRRGP